MPRVALIVNDMGDVNIDSQLVKGGPTEWMRSEEKLVEMSNGCVCCTLREDLLKEVSQLAAQGKFDYLLIESSGIAEPLPVLQTFLFEDEDGLGLHDVAQLDTLVTVIDAGNFLEDFQSVDEFRDRGLGLGDGDDRDIVHLLAHQVEVANVVVPNKVDLVTQEQLGILRGMILSLNPGARLIEATFGRVDPTHLLNTGLLTEEWAETHEDLLVGPANGWGEEAEKYGFESFTFREWRPFHPDRIGEFIAGGGFEGAIRSKGFVWLATRMDLVGIWQQAGRVGSLTCGGKWWSSVAPEEWPPSMEFRLELVQNSRAPHGDRRQELVVIRHELDVTAFREGLDRCLLTDEEFEAGPEAWADFEDPVAPWDVEGLDHSHHDHEH